MNKHQKMIFSGAYYTFLTSGLVSMIINSIMPFIMDDYQLTYDLTGTLLSLLSTGADCQPKRTPVPYSADS